MTLIEEYGDLFDMDQEWCLAHCVGSDFIMGKGIATIFKSKYGNVDWLLQNSKGVGTTLLLPKNKINRNVFYLITKKWSRYSKPTYVDLENSIIDMFYQAKLHGINKIAMPKIGCGLDGLEWNLVKKIILEHKPIDIDVCVKYI